MERSRCLTRGLLDLFTAHKNFVCLRDQECLNLGRFRLNLGGGIGKNVLQLAIHWKHASATPNNAQAPWRNPTMLTASHTLVIQVNTAPKMACQNQPDPDRNATPPL
ncbi:hypothetical protein RA29_15825 [Tateyamaria sp. ANG-S1]|nr:hypothetical protein RA29_15825 [Tateyamaria sp. ANG-S1]